MDITGSQKINAPRQKVFDALFDPNILKNSIPNCEGAEYVDFPTGRQLKMVVSPNIPGLKGTFNVYLQTIEVTPPSHLVIVSEPSSNVGSVKARCAIDLAEAGSATDLSYNAHAELSGAIGATPEFIIKPIVKSTLDQFFKNFEKQVSGITA